MLNTASCDRLLGVKSDDDDDDQLPFTVSSYFERNARKFYDKSIAFFNNLNKYELGIFMALVVLCSIQILFILMSLTNFLLLTFNLLRVLMTIFCLFSIYTWLSIIYGSYWSESSIYLTFFTCFLSEFFIQFVTHNLKHSHNDQPLSQIQQQQQQAAYDESSYFSFIFAPSRIDESNYDNVDSKLRLDNLLLTDNARHVLLIGTLCILISLISNFKLRENILLILVICLTRLYGSIYFSSFMPFSI